ncbi:unnamed protein product, partial [marine sediment metagenome]
KRTVPGNEGDYIYFPDEISLGGYFEAIAVGRSQGYIIG